MIYVNMKAIQLLTISFDKLILIKLIVFMSQPKIYWFLLIFVVIYRGNLKIFLVFRNSIFKIDFRKYNAKSTRYM